MTVIGLITQSFFYTMLEAGMALIAVNMPSLRVFSISIKTMDVINSVKSLLDLSFIRGSSPSIERHDLEAYSSNGNAYQSDSVTALHRDVLKTSVSIPESCGRVN